METIVARECLPLKSLDEVRSWKPSDSTGKCHILLAVPAAGEGRAKLLACHDFKGGYLDDRFVEGTVDCEGYVFWHWWNIDTFVYFSHHFVTIPPLCWISAGHRHQVKVLGALITEWDAGKQICADFLKSEAEYHFLADQMVAIAVHYGFDGWLLNIENTLQVEEVSAMRSFVEYLTCEMHRHIVHAEVIWYDSVTRDGELRWQNELNEHNRLFFDACDGVFLNYTWKEPSLEQSKQLSSEVGRQHDVYVGVDVFGRGCWGDGGFNTIEAVKMARKFDLSIALFAHGWTCEKADNWDQFVDNESRFWSLLQHDCPQRPVSSLPLNTGFCRGWGKIYSVNGQVVLRRRWTNVSLQQVQANVRVTESHTHSDAVAAAAAAAADDDDDDKDAGHLCFTADEAFNGGGCLQLTGAADGSRHTTRLFSFDVDMEGDLYISYTFKLAPSAGSTELCIGLTFDRHQATQLWLLAADNGDESVDVCSSLLRGLADQNCRRFAHRQQTVNGWTTRSYLLSELNNFHLTEVFIATAGSGDRSSYATVYFGQLQILPEDYRKAVTVPVPDSYDCSGVELEGCLSYCESSGGRDDAWQSARLSWLLSDDVLRPAAVSHYLVWTCCPIDCVRTLSALDSTAATGVVSECATDHSSVSAQRERDDDVVIAVDGPLAAKISRHDRSSRHSNLQAAMTDAVRISLSLPDAAVDCELRDDEVKNDSDELSCADAARKRETADLPSAWAGGTFIDVSQEDRQRCTDDATVWRCLGPTPVNSFSVESSRNMHDYRRNFRVQPILLSGAALPHINVVIK